jgi:hypothetical protein
VAGGNRRECGQLCPAGRRAAIQLRAERSWRQTPAVVLTDIPAAGQILGHSRGPARLTPSGDPERTGQIPVSTGLSTGRPMVPLWLAPAGSRARPRLTHRGLVANEAAAALVATVALGITLLSLAWAGRWLLDRRRVADWEAEWAVVGPQYAKRFRPRG